MRVQGIHARAGVRMRPRQKGAREGVLQSEVPRRLHSVPAEGGGLVKGGATTTVSVAGCVSQGTSLKPSKEKAILPVAVLEEYEFVYCVADASLAEFDVSEGDLLIVEPKKKAETGELVLALLADQIFVGHWWAKHGQRDVVGADGQHVVVSGATIIGAINLIVRSVHGR